MHRRRLTLLALAVLVLLLALFWLRGGKPEDVAVAPPAAVPFAARMADATAASTRAAAPAAAHTPTAAGTSAATPEGTPTPADDLADAELPEVVSLASRAAEEYREMAQYPPWSRPFGEDGADPILRDREVSPISAAGPDGEEPILTVFPDQVSFEAPEPVLLYAFLTRGGERVPAESIAATLTTELMQPLGEVTFSDDGGEGDRAAGDLVYTARIALDEALYPELSDSFLARVRAVTSEQQERLAATGFLYSNPHAQLTGNYRDTIVDGSLAIDAEIEVTRPGRFHLEGTLYDPSGARGLAEAHTAADLPAGRHWLRLVFYGRILHQSGVDGPYLLRFLALSTTTGMPNAKNRLVENPHRTGAYRFAQFSDEPFNDPDLLGAAERMEVP